MGHNSQTAGYFIQFDEKLARFYKRLASYLENPNVDNIHDVRTSFRRLEACYSIFPGTSKTKSTENFLTLGKKFFRLNSAVRDSDITLEKLHVQQAGASPISEYLHQIRAQSLEQAMIVGQQLALLPLPRLRHGNLQLDQHLQHQVEKRINNILHFIPLISNDEENVAELHAMRKQAKKLFYLLELDNPADCPAMTNLKKLQTVAGDIHDCDVTVEFLHQHAELVPHADTLVKTEQRKRHSCYKKLLTQLGRELWKPLWKLANN